MIVISYSINGRIVFLIVLMEKLNYMLLKRDDVGDAAVDRVSETRLSLETD